VTTINIRQMRDDDINEFHSVLDNVAREGKFLVFLNAPSFDHVQQVIRKSLARKEPRLVALSGETIVGWCHVIPSEFCTTAHCGTLTMGLLPPYRGQGTGKTLLRRALTAAQAFGLCRIQLGVFAENHRAINLYRNFGFVKEGLRKNAVRINEVFLDEVMMALVDNSRSTNA